MTEATIHALPVTPKLRHLNRQLWKMRAGYRAAQKARLTGLMAQFASAERRYIEALIKHQEESGND